MKKIKYLLFVIFFSCLGIISVDAASFSVKANTTNAVVGSQVKITVAVSGSDAAGWEYCLNYDNSIFKFQSANSDTGSTCVKTGSTLIGYKTVTFNFKVSKSGSGTFSLSGAAIYNEDGEQLSLSKGSVVVKAKTQAEIEASWSDNAFLSSLKIDGYDLNPEFNKNTTEYDVEVPNEVESITIKATKADPSASVSGAGTKKLTEGINVFKIVVTAEKGNKKTYVVNVNRKELNPINVVVNGNEYTVVRKKDALEAPSFYASEVIDIDGNEVPAFKSDITDFTLVGLKDTEGNIRLYSYDGTSYKLYKQVSNDGFTFIPQEVKELVDGFEVKKIIKIGEIEIESYGSKEDNDFLLVYGMNASNGETNWYKYDTKEETFQRYVLKENVKNEDNNFYFILTMVFAILSGITILLVIILLSMNSKLRKKNNRVIELLEQGKCQINSEVRGDVSEIKDEVKKSNKCVEEKKENIEETIINNIAKSNLESCSLDENKEEIKKEKKDIIDEKDLSKRELRRLEKLKMQQEQNELKKMQDDFFKNEEYDEEIISKKSSNKRERKRK